MRTGDGNTLNGKHFGGGRETGGRVQSCKSPIQECDAYSHCVLCIMGQQCLSWETHCTGRRQRMIPSLPQMVSLPSFTDDRLLNIRALYFCMDETI